MQKIDKTNKGFLFLLNIVLTLQRNSQQKLSIY